MKLPLPDHLSWLALRRVRRGGVSKLGDRYFDGGQPLGILLVELLAMLRDQGLLEVAEPGPADGLARVSCSVAGQAYYRSLCQRQRAPLPAPPPQPVTTPEVATPAPQPNHPEPARVELPTESRPPRP